MAIILPRKPFRRGAERRSSPDEGSARSRNRPASGHNTLPSCDAKYGVYAPAHVRTPSERAYLFPQIWAFQSAIRHPATRHRDCPHCRGNGDRQAVSGSRAESIHLPGLLAGMATHATGTAHPRQTTLATMTRNRSESVVGSMARARSLDVHSDKTHRMSGAKAGADVCPLGQRRGAVGAVAEPLAESLPDGGKAMRFPSTQARFRANLPLQARQGRGDPPSPFSRG